jgi:hypothetical protein
MKPHTPEGRALRDALATAPVLVSAHRPCSCGEPDCPFVSRGVAIHVGGQSAVAKTPRAVAEIIRSLEQAAEFAFGQGVD